MNYDASGEDNTPNFAHLGTPRSFEKNEVVGNIHASHASTDPRIRAIDDLSRTPPKKPSYNFKLIKTNTINPSAATYIVWGMILVIILISVAASLTQGILLAKDKLGMNSDNTGNTNLDNGQGNPDDTAAGQNTVAGASAENPNGEARQLGSDDGRTVSEQSLNFQPMYKVSNPDQVQNLGVTAQGYYVADMKTGERILAKNYDKQYPIASVSKLMTALVAYEKMDLQKVVVVSRDSYSAYGSEGELIPGERIKLGDLMYPVLMESSNDGAEVIAESYGRAEFMAEMNKKAALLGMNDTYYEDPSGLNPKNVSTSEDLFKLLKYVKEKAPILYDMTRVREFGILKHKWFNKNRFLNTDIFLGGKNGYIDESLWTTASMFEVTLAKGGKRQIGIVLLKSQNREGDATKLIKFLEKSVYYTETGSF